VFSKIGLPSPSFNDQSNIAYVGKNVTIFVAKTQSLSKVQALYNPFPFVKK